ncbi:MAG: hypothetical protein ACRDYF_08675, partial [Acidimicrobiia bacterium]
MLAGVDRVQALRVVELDPEDAGLGEVEVELGVIAVGHGVVFPVGYASTQRGDCDDHHYQDCDGDEDTG